jgi:hypothetical protein
MAYMDCSQAVEDFAAAVVDCHRQKVQYQLRHQTTTAAVELADFVVEWSQSHQSQLR